MEGRPDGDVEHRGEYLAIEPPSLLSFTWISKHTDDKPTVVTIEFHERGTGTELVLTHRRLPPTAGRGASEGLDRHRALARRGVDPRVEPGESALRASRPAGRRSAPRARDAAR